MWIIRTKDSFQLLIQHAERQPSNGTVRKVEDPDDETRFAVAYSFAPDIALQSMLVRLSGSLWNFSILTLFPSGENLQ